MKFKFDHDYHIHSELSLCSNDKEQTSERILEYAKEKRLSEICLTNHYWDSSIPCEKEWYIIQNFEHISKALPLPQEKGIEFLFGCETDLDKDLTLGIPKTRFDAFDFIIIPTTHLHMTGFTITEEDRGSNEQVAKLWVKRLEHVLNLPLPFHKVGMAHLACRLINRNSREDYLKTLELIPDRDMERLFAKAAALGCGIELNSSDMSFSDSEADTVLRMFRVAKNQGCKFYLGSDAHHPNVFKRAGDIFERAICLLGLCESDKFHIVL